MAISPENQPIRVLRKMIAHCRTFQEWCGVGSWGAALDRIHYELQASTATRPFAVIRYGASGNVPTAGGSRQFSLPWGVLGVIFEEDVATADLDEHNKISDPGAITMAIQERVQTIAAELFELAGTDGMLAHIRRAEMPDGPALSDEDENDVYAQAVLEIEQGLEG